MTVNVAIVYYSATGTLHSLAQAAAEGAELPGTQVRLRKVSELASEETIRANPAWAEHRAATAHLPEAAIDDLDWADAVLFGTPSRFGNVAAQLKLLMDTTGPLWRAGKLVDKVTGGFTSAGSAHGGFESTLLALYQSLFHWGAIVVPAGYATPELFNQGNPYGASAPGRWGELPTADELAATRAYAARVVGVARQLAGTREGAHEMVA